ncbi:Membrane associated serine protease, rhomboid family [Thermomonospora echinospora]|uniref:Membrane associated serine protease, rhomboid family n=1 Tax=Thermomonospora echinospora TaxID=1992 RepID=A0A1H6CIP2_9ACTN|nr:rhomboid family intramembrane serine protease [Thermomonospora echinospora]SEG72788.1 Membrane associated serine protease, rhomboid family [Thermomonospora echinospora]
MSNPVVPRRSRSEGLMTHATRAVSAAVLVVAVTAGMWALEIYDYAAGNRLDAYGIRAHDAGELPQILTAPFLHGGFEHLMANTMPFLVLGFLAAARGIGRFLAAALIIIVVGGLGVWFTGSPTVETLGSSILIFGFFGYLLGRGLFERNLLDLVIAVGVAVFYGTMIYGVLPTDPMISWQGHLFGLIGGVLAAFTLRRRIEA